MAVVSVRQDMKQKPMDFPDMSVKTRGKVIAMLGWKRGLVIDCLLDIGHDVINVLRC